MSTVVPAAPSCFDQHSAEQELRRRNLKAIENEITPSLLRRGIVSRRLNSLPTVLFLALVMTGIFILYSSLSSTSFLRFPDPHSYVLVLDAGSTGTRIHVYQFRSTLDRVHGDEFILKNEIFEERKPGLSSLAGQINKVEEQVDALLQIAHQQVNRFKHRSTPLVLRATAGLRLLNETAQKLLLDGVATTFARYGFYRPKMDIAIMNETDEGIDAWLTLVYLKGEQFYRSRIAALDLGGGSTQITYNPSLLSNTSAEKSNPLSKAPEIIEPGQTDTLPNPSNKHGEQPPKTNLDQAGPEEVEPVKVVQDDDMHQFRMFGRDFELYSKSYLGYGLMMARQTIFIGETNDSQLVQSHQLKSRCFLDRTPGKFRFQDVSWTVQGHSGLYVNAEDRFGLCLATIDHYVALNVQLVTGLDQMSIYVFSYFYDIAHDAGLLTDSSDLSSSITILPVRVLKQTAANVCHSSETLTKYPFLCFDITYIYSLLTKGYGLSDGIQLHICKKIQEFEVSWSLGLALKLL